MKKIVLFAKYFGVLGDSIDYWFFSVKNNPSIDFIFLTDNDYLIKSYSDIANLHFYKINKEEFFERLQNACGDVEINKDNFGYRCNQFRPMFGIMFKDLIAGYDFWGHVDTDIVIGNIRSFLSDDLLNRYEKLLDRGHFSLYRNIENVNSRFLLTVDYSPVDYKMICKTKYCLNFDEMRGINKVYEKMNIPVFINNDFYFDCSTLHKAFLTNKKNHKYYKKNVYFKYSNSHLFCVDTFGRLSTEILYVHFQKRRIISNVTFNDDLFYIFPNEIVSREYNYEHLLKQASKRDYFYPIFALLRHKIASIPKMLEYYFLRLKKFFK